MTQATRELVHNASGKSVTGTYHGVEFTGTVTSTRPNYASWDEIAYIKLAAPITVFGSERTDLVIDSALIDKGLASI